MADMLRKKVKPLQVNLDNKRRDYKGIVEEVQNEAGQDFNAESRTNTATRLAQQAFSIRKLPEAGITNGLLVAPSFTGKTTWLSSWIQIGRAHV